MKKRASLILGLSLGTIGLLTGILYFNSTVTFIDRPFFLSDDKVTIIATRVDWMCNCANFIDTTNYKSNPVTEPGDNDYFFIEAGQPGDDWNRDHFIKNKYVRLTGQFYLDKGIPKEYELGHLEDKPDHARVFKFDKIEYLTDNRHEAQQLTTTGLVNGGVICVYKVLSSLQRLPTVDSDDLVGLSIPRCSIAKAS